MTTVVGFLWGLTSPVSPYLKLVKPEADAATTVWRRHRLLIQFSLAMGGRRRGRSVAFRTTGSLGPCAFRRG